MEWGQQGKAFVLRGPLDGRKGGSESWSCLEDITPGSEGTRTKDLGWKSVYEEVCEGSELGYKVGEEPRTQVGQIPPTAFFLWQKLYWTTDTPIQLLILSMAAFTSQDQSRVLAYCAYCTESWKYSLYRLFTEKFAGTWFTCC